MRSDKFIIMRFYSMKSYSLITKLYSRNEQREHHEARWIILLIEKNLKQVRVLGKCHAQCVQKSNESSLELLGTVRFANG